MKNTMTCAVFLFISTLFNASALEFGGIEAQYPMYSDSDPFAIAVATNAYNKAMAETALRTAAIVAATNSVTIAYKAAISDEATLRINGDSANNVLIEARNAAVANNSNRINTANANISTANINIANNSNGLVTANAKITTANSNIATVSNRVTTAFVYIANSSNRVNAANANIANNSNGLLTANANIAANSNGLVTAFVYIADNSNGLVTANSKISNTSNDVASAISTHNLSTNSHPDKLTYSAASNIFMRVYDSGGGVWKTLLPGEVQ